MAENPHDSAADNEKARFGAADKSGSETLSNLPMVVAPKLDAGEDEAVDEEIDDGADEAAPVVSRRYSSRFLMLAGTVAFAAAFGSFVGSVSGSGLAHYLSPTAPASSAAMTTDAMREMKLELAELSAIKANLDSTTRSTTTQFAKLSDRLDRLDQRSASAAAETTGSIAPASPPPPAPPKITDRILQDWIVQDVQNGRALLQSRYGAMFDVGEGSMLPGVGRIDSIKRQDGQWLVLTERGTITSGR
jgi:hypothetical protein